MRTLSLLLLLLSLQARAEDAPAVDMPVTWGKGSFQDRRAEDVRKLAEDLLPDAPVTPAPAPDKNDNHSAK